MPSEYEAALATLKNENDRLRAENAAIRLQYAAIRRAMGVIHATGVSVIEEIDEIAKEAHAKRLAETSRLRT